VDLNRFFITINVLHLAPVDSIIDQDNVPIVVKIVLHAMGVVQVNVILANILTCIIHISVN
jgi:hypothetical protein